MDKNSSINIDYHIHTKITDGLCSPVEIIDEVKKLGIKKIAFTEHVREKLTYDWFKFRDEILSINPRGIKIIIGIETKVLNSEGKLDVSKDIFECADIILGSIHGSQNIEWLLNSDCDIIAHPQFNSSNIEKFLNCNKAIELNPRYPLEDEIISKLVECKNNKFSFGSDTHRIEDLKTGQTYFSTIDNRYKINDRLISIKSK